MLSIYLLFLELSCAASVSAFLRSPFVSRSPSSTHIAMALPQSAPQELSPRALVNRGMQTFREGDVAGSIDFFDKAEAAEPMLKPYLWQRGLSYYYADKYKEGSDQFRFDVKVNPLDVEEIVWDIACQARLGSGAFPPTNKLSLPQGKTDRRKIMATVYSLFRGDGATEHDLASAGHDGSKSDEFYSLFYLGLYCESQGEMAKAESYMKAATKTAYASASGDYMAAVASVHCQVRGWA